MYNSDLTEKFSQIRSQLISTGFKESPVDAAIDDTDRFILQQRVLKNIYGCKKCRMSCPNPVPGVGSISSPLMIVAESPSLHEIELGVPFTGPAGHALIVMLNALSIYRGNVYMTNVTHCNVKDSAGKWIAPGKDEIYACSTNLLAEIQVVRPKVILALGNPALWATSNDFSKKISKERGNPYQLSEEFGIPNIQVISSWHPSYVIRQKGPDFEKAKTELWTDLNRAYKMACLNNPTFSWSQRPAF